MRPSAQSRNEWLGLILHPLLIALGCAFSIALLIAIGGMLTLPHPNPSLAADSVFSPIFWIPSLFFGGIVNRVVRNRWAYLAPAAVAVILVIGVMFWDVSLFRHSSYVLNVSHGHPWRYELERLFLPVSPFSHVKADQTLIQLFLTFPLMASIAYAVGGWFGVRFSAAESKSTMVTTRFLTTK